jgi:hypothetical protein
LYSQQLLEHYGMLRLKSIFYLFFQLFDKTFITEMKLVIR